MKLPPVPMSGVRTSTPAQRFRRWLPLFTAIDTCPFCGVGLHEVERSQDRGS
jgi:hypothetical protein